MRQHTELALPDVPRVRGMCVGTVHRRERNRNISICCHRHKRLLIYYIAVVEVSFVDIDIFNVFAKIGNISPRVWGSVVVE